MTYTQVRITTEDLERLRKLAAEQHRTMAAQLSVLIAQAIKNPLEDLFERNGAERKNDE